MSITLLDQLGQILEANALKPGAGVDKELPCVGDYYITGIVNICGILDQMLLQTTRLHTVMSLSDQIYDGIAHFIPTATTKGFL